jgi:hypothetical protein
VGAARAAALTMAPLLASTTRVRLDVLPEAPSTFSNIGQDGDGYGPSLGYATLSDPANHRCAPWPAVVYAAALSPPVCAHDIADEIMLRGFVKPDGDRLHVLVRIPLPALLTLDLPRSGPRADG